MKIKLLNDKAQLPTRGSEYAAGYDLYASEAIMVRKGCTTLIPTGIAIELQENQFAGIYSRSGFAKDGLVVANGVGVIDPDYRGPIGVLIYNQEKFDTIVDEGTRIAQMVVQEFVPVQFEEVEELSETVRGGGGFGSSGES